MSIYHPDTTNSTHPTPPTAAPGMSPPPGVDRVQVDQDAGTADAEPRTDDRIRVRLVNDYELVLRGLQAMLAPFEDRITVVGKDASENPDSDLSRRADIALFDTFAARRDVLQRAKGILDDRMVNHVVLYTWDAPDEFLRGAREIGVDAVISKSCGGLELVDALERVAGGERVGMDTVLKGERSRNDGPDLTAREQEVLALLALGLSNAQIAHELFLSVDTIKTHVRRVFTKLGVNNRTQAAMKAVMSSDALRPSSGGRAGAS